MDALREAQAAERAQRNEVESSHRREEELQAELKAMMHSQACVTDELENTKHCLQSEQAHRTSLQAQLKNLQANSDERRNVQVAQQEQLQKDLTVALSHQQGLLDQLRDRDTQVQHCGLWLTIVKPCCYSRKQTG